MNSGPQFLVQWEPRWKGFVSSIRPALARSARRNASDPAHLTYEWEPRWQSFLAAIKPALAKSERPLEGECPSELPPSHGAAASFVAHLALIAVLMFTSQQVARTPRLDAQAESKYEVIYYSAPYLPQTEDAGGAQAGRTGESGGNEAYHPTQVIHIARGNRMTETVAEAPKLLLPRTDNAANLLAFSPAIPIAPAVEPPRTMGKLPTFPAEIVPPAPTVERSRMPVVPVYGAEVVAPAPAVPSHTITALPIANADVVPPPVSAPPRDLGRDAKLALPAPSVVPPPPAAEAHQLRAIAGVAPSGFGDDVVPPPPNIGGRALSTRTQTGFGDSPEVVPPAPVGGAADLRAAASHSRTVALSGDGADVVPPPPSVNAAELKSAKPGRALPGATSGDSGYVISLKPGSSVGMPANAGAGSLAMSPNGSDKNGAGGSGGGTGTGLGTGPGSGTSGSGPGAAAAGNGRGADPAAHGGTSAAPGPGGSGLGGDNHGGIAGVTIRGGVVTLPSFGSPEAPDVPAHGTEPHTQGPPAITVVASSRSGGALNAYGVLKGSKVYTIYLQTRLGPAVLEYAEHRSSNEQFESDLTAPEAISTNLPSGLAKARFIVSCVIDRSGVLKNVQVLDNAGVEASAMLTAIQDWRFRPVLRGQQAIEVDAILGFGVTTR